MKTEKKKAELSRIKENKKKTTKKNDVKSLEKSDVLFKNNSSAVVKDFFILNDGTTNIKNTQQQNIIKEQKIFNKNSFLIFVNYFHNKFGYSFYNLSLVKKVFLHSSEKPDAKENNSRLETLGDSIISFFIIKKLFNLKDSILSSGKMSKIKSFLVSRHVLGGITDKMNLIRFFKSKISKIEKEEPISLYMKCSLFEALIGAIFIDTNQNFDVVCNILDRIFKTFLPDILNNDEIYDYKSFIQTMCMKKFKKIPLYEVVEKNEESKESLFTVKMYIDRQILSVGTGKNIRLAEKHCAIEACKNLN